jgi:hypothetical protein
LFVLSSPHQDEPQFDYWPAHSGLARATIHAMNRIGVSAGEIRGEWLGN